MNDKPPIGATPYYVRNHERIKELCEAIIRQTESGHANHDKIKLWCLEIVHLNEMDRILRYEEEQKVWTEDKKGNLHQMT